MKQHAMSATVKGVTCEGEPFIENLEFTLIPPSDTHHYGTGYYMTVKSSGNTHLVDVRYERTTDIEILADRWMQGWYGKNAHEISKQFPDNAEDVKH